MPAGRPHEAAGNGSPRWMTAGPLRRVHRTRPTGRLTPFHGPDLRRSLGALGAAPSLLRLVHAVLRQEGLQRSPAEFGIVGEQVTVRVHRLGDGTDSRAYSDLVVPGSGCAASTIRDGSRHNSAPEVTGRRKRTWQDEVSPASFTLRFGRCIQRLLPAALTQELAELVQSIRGVWIHAVSAELFGQFAEPHPDAAGSAVLGEEQGLAAGVERLA
jgi:hypothetical protein